jgi:hypothetical protein
LSREIPLLSDDARRTLKSLPKFLSRKSDTSSLSTGRSVEISPSVSVSNEVTSSNSDRLQSLWALRKEDITLPLEIEELFAVWKSTPSAFLRGNEVQPPTSPNDHYRYARLVQSALAYNRILWRFVAITYFDIVHSTSDRYDITKDAIAYVVNIICGSSRHDREEVETDIVSWAQEGRSYRSLVNKLGGSGCFFFYPTSISEWM